MNDVSEHRRESPTRHSALIMMLGAVASSGLQGNFCRLQKSFGDEDSSVDQEVHYESKVLTNRGKRHGTHGKDCAGLVGRRHEIFAQGFWSS